MKFSHTIKGKIAATTLLRWDTHSQLSQIFKPRKSEQMRKEDFHYLINSPDINIKQFISHMYLWYLFYPVEEKNRLLTWTFISTKTKLFENFVFFYWHDVETIRIFHFMKRVRIRRFFWFVFFDCCTNTARKM